MESHILLIDDDEDERVLLEMALQHCPKQAKIHQVMPLEQAVAFANTFSLTPDLIFLDLRLANVSGLAMLAWIRGHNRLKDVPVVVWSHAAREADVEQSRLRGSHYFLSKIADQAAPVGRLPVRNLASVTLLTTKNAFELIQRRFLLGRRFTDNPPNGDPECRFAAAGAARLSDGADASRRT